MNHNATAPHLADDELVIMMGGPGAGKGTHCGRLAQELGATHLSSGEIFRAERRPDVMAQIAEGNLATEDDFKRILRPAIVAAAGSPLILDGVTKKPKEAAWLLDSLDALGRRLRCVIYLEVDEDEAKRRIGIADRGRDDDHAHKQDLRWLLFREETLQSIAVYRSAGLLETISSSRYAPTGSRVERSIDDVHADILAAIARRAGVNA